MSKTPNKKRLEIERSDDKILIYSYPYKDNPYRKKLIREFEHDENVKKITNFDKQTKANEEVILNWYKNRSKEKYVATSEDEIKTQLSEIKRDHRVRIKHFTKSRILFSPTKKKLNFDYMYVVVKVKIYLDGYNAYSKGRSDYFYYNETRGEKRIYKAHGNKGIPNEQLSSAISQASMRAIAPFGSKVKFDIINWHYAYHQQEGDFR